MKTVEIRYSIHVPDNFEPGDCENCPARKVQGHENAARIWEETVSCGLGFAKATCPIRTSEEATAHWTLARAKDKRVNKEYICSKCHRLVRRQYPPSYCETCGSKMSFFG